jgi:hypothetical protein
MRIFTLHILLNTVIDATKNSQIRMTRISLHFQAEAETTVSPAYQTLLYWPTHIHPVPR